jgi:hypothetical protein
VGLKAGLDAEARAEILILFSSTSTMVVINFASEYMHKTFTRNTTVYKYVKKHYPISKEHQVENPLASGLIPVVHSVVTFLTELPTMYMIRTLNYGTLRVRRRHGWEMRKWTVIVSRESPDALRLLQYPNFDTKIYSLLG